VFGMGTGGTSSLLSPQVAESAAFTVPSKLNNITKLENHLVKLSTY
jgi:hypothetical protein